MIFLRATFTCHECHEKMYQEKVYEKEAPTNFVKDDFAEVIKTIRQEEALHEKCGAGEEE